MENAKKCSKNIDKHELINILKFEPFCPQKQNCTEASFFTYDTPAHDFVLGRLKNYSGNFPVEGPTVVFVTSGTLDIAISGEYQSESVCLTKGMSVFVPSGADRKNIFVQKNNYTAYTATAG
jgi:mannose-6-phosphate isomerase class I